MYYFIELAGSVTNIALLSLFMSRLFVRNKIQSKWYFAFSYFTMHRTVRSKSFSELGDTEDALLTAWRFFTSKAVL